MTLRDDILSVYRRPSFDVLIGGRYATSLVTGWSVACSLSQVNNQATITFAERPSYAEETAKVEIWAGYSERVQIFSGYFSGVSWDFPGGVALDARDVLNRTTLPWGGADRVYANQTSAAVIRNLLEAVGITEHDILDDDPAWVLGELADVVLKTGETPWSLIQRIDTLEGFRTFCDASGVARRMRLSGNPGLTAAWDFVDGRHTKIRRQRALDGIVNKVIVRGLEYEEVIVEGQASAINTYLDQEVAPELRPRYVTEEIDDALIETNERAAAVAQRMVADRNRRPESATIDSEGNPLVRLFSTVSLSSGGIETDYATAIVVDVRHSFDASSGFLSTFGTSGGNLSGYNASAPVAQFNAVVALEHEDTGSAIEPRYFVQLDAGASFDPDGNEGDLTYSWVFSVDAGTVTATGSTTSRYLNLVATPPATALTITLTVTDAQALIGTISRVLALAESEMLLEALYTAEDSIVAYSGDGEASWTERTLPGGVTTTALMPLAPVWGQIWGCSDGRVRASFDGLSTDPVDLGQPAPGHGAVTAVWVNELIDTRIWAGHADGAVAFGALNLDTRTVSWMLAGNAGASPVREIAESPFQEGELRVMAGNQQRVSFDAAANWITLHTGDTAWRQAAGYDRSYAGFLNDDSPLREEQGNTVTLPVLVPPVRHIRGLSPGATRRELYLVDDQGRLFRSDDLVTAAQTGQSPVGLNHLVRSGALNGIVYGAGGDGVVSNGGVLKSIRGADPIYVRRTGLRPVRMVGYGPAVAPAPPAVNATLYRPTWGLTSGGGVWKQDIVTGGWTLKNTGLPQQTSAAGPIYWRHIAASAVNPLRLLLIGNSTTSDQFYTSGGGVVCMAGTTTPAVWRSDNGGDTWYAYAPPFPGAPVVGIFRIGLPEWSKDNADVGFLPVMILKPDPPFPSSAFFSLWRFSAAGWSLLTTPPELWGGDVIPFAAAGAAGEVALTAGDGQAYVRPADSTFQGVRYVTPPIDAPFFVDTFPGQSRVAVITGLFGGVWLTLDYRTLPFARRTGGIWSGLDGSARYAAITADGSLYVGSQAGGYLRIQNLFGAATQTPVGDTTAPARYLRSDRQTRRVLAGVRPDQTGVNYSTDGSVWQVIPGPPGVPNGNLSPLTLEVIGV